MGIGIVIGLIILAYRLSRDSNQPTGTSGDKPASSNVSLQLCLALLMVWFGALIIWFVIIEQHREIPSLAVVAVLYIVISPYLTSRLTALCGLVKTSYYLGGLSHVVFARNPYSAGLLRGVQAAHKLKGNDNKREALQWLKNKWLSRRGKIYSGDMVMATIIECHLTHPNDAHHIAKQLKQLEGIARASIPQAISRHAFKYALTPALAANQWQELYDVAKQWDTPANNRLAKYVRHYCGAYIFKQRDASKIKSAYYKLFTLPFKALFTLHARNRADEDYDTQLAHKRYDLASLTKAHTISEEEAASYQARILSETNTLKWQQRAKELGAWQQEEAWQTIEKSVQQCLSQKSSATLNGAEDSQYFDNIDKQYKNLNYLGHSISRRLATKDLGHGAQNFLDWAKMEAILNDIASDPSAHISAFQSIENIIWNWVADLWNIKKERCLVHYICVKCSPLAFKTGNQELHNLLTGISRGEYN